MAIKIKQLEKIANTYTENRYLYKDLFLDISRTKIEAPGYRLPIPGTDIKADFDVGAIINSLTNLFNTLPGQRFLFPKYGLDLYQFLFEPITQFNGELLGTTILQAIKTYEPRVIPRQVNVKLLPDENQYNVTIAIEIPALRLLAEPEFLLDVKKQTFIFLPTARNK
jgi:predicted component of type VI protein secretion system